MIKAYYIPSGPKNLNALFPEIDFSLVESYQVSCFDNNGALIAITPSFQFNKVCEDDLTLCFVNALSGTDTAQLALTKIVHSTKSESFKTPLSYPLVQSQHAINRINLTANDTYTGIVIVPENQLSWIKELMDSPKVWIESPTDYIPVVLTDSSYPVLNEQAERYEYQINIEFILSHEKITIRS